ncbi:fibroin heavy chain isoform X2 [Cydia pomonella]|uniref:fibroin heavy chain isoform X2 n=1 Tax=Cydia pomonella TaxID=82600 RepID=UPI002ADE2652|nr:fibroin heavy chain isoform X2 [Cydia pomonella]
MHAAAARYVSVSELYSTDEVELLLDEIRDLEPTSCRGEDIQDFEIAGSGLGATAGSGARSPGSGAGTERSWDSHAHYRRAPPPPPRPLAPLYCRCRHLLTAQGAAMLFITLCSLGCASCVWAGAGLQVWALPGAGARAAPAAGRRHQHPAALGAASAAHHQPGRAAAAALGQAGLSSARVERQHAPSRRRGLPARTPAARVPARAHVSHGAVVHCLGVGAELRVLVPDAGGAAAARVRGGGGGGAAGALGGLGVGVGPLGVGVGPLGARRVPRGAGSAARARARALHQPPEPLIVKAPLVR